MTKKRGMKTRKRLCGFYKMSGLAVPERMVEKNKNGQGNSDPCPLR